MTNSSNLSSVAEQLASVGPSAMDGISLSRAPLAPEVLLHLADDATVLWARLGAQFNAAARPPYWASAWPGGQALARYLLDNRVLVQGKSVLDIGAGSGIVAIAAGLAGARSVTAYDIDPIAMSAISLNAAANEVTVDVKLGDPTDGPVVQADVVLAGDMFYSESVADRVTRFLTRLRRSGAEVLVGDPGRGFLPRTGMELVTTYTISGVYCDALLSQAQVFRLGSVPPGEV